MSDFLSLGKRIRLSDFSWGNICCSYELIAGFWLSSTLNHSIVKPFWLFRSEIIKWIAGCKAVVWFLFVVGFGGVVFLKGEKTF